MSARVKSGGNLELKSEIQKSRIETEERDPVLIEYNHHLVWRLNIGKWMG